MSLLLRADEDGHMHVLDATLCKESTAEEFASNSFQLQRWLLVSPLGTIWSDSNPAALIEILSAHLGDANDNPGKN